MYRNRYRKKLKHNFLLLKNHEFQNSFNFSKNGSN